MGGRSRLSVLFSLWLVSDPHATSFGQEPGTPSPGWPLYPDTDPLLTYAGDWQTFSVVAATGGTLTGTADPNATLMLTFEGTGVEVIYSTGPEGRTFAARLDGHTTTAYSYSDSYSYANVLPFHGLAPGHHTLTVTNGDGAIWIEAVRVQAILGFHQSRVSHMVVLTGMFKLGGKGGHRNVYPDK